MKSRNNCNVILQTACIWQILSLFVKQTAKQSPMDQVADDSTTVSLETLLTEICTSNEKLAKQRTKISDDVKEKTQLI